LGLGPAECVFVDDDPELVAAAIELGYSGRALCRDGVTDGGPGAPVPFITDLREIVELF